MTLSFLAKFPSTRGYVLKLRHDAAASREQIAGRLENMSSGRHYEFNNADQLLACLAVDLSYIELQPEE